MKATMYRKYCSGMNHSGLSPRKFVYKVSSWKRRVGNFTEIELALYPGTEI